MSTICMQHGVSAVRQLLRATELCLGHGPRVMLSLINVTRKCRALLRTWWSVPSRGHQPQPSPWQPVPLA